MVLGGLFFGFLVGVAIMAGFKYLSDLRRKARIRKIAGIYLLSQADEVDFKKLCGSSYPNHISFLTFDKVNWLNEMLVKFWPFVVEATEQRVKLALEPMLEMYRPAGISSLTLEKFHLGKVPPQIDGVRVQRLQKGQVHMDMDFKWGGDGDVVLNAGVMGTKLPIQLKKLSFFSTIRVIFQLSDEIPCISALVVAVLPNPKFQIDYKLKVIGGSTGSIPGLGDMIEDLVNSSVSDQLEWPHRIVLPVGDTPADIISELGLKLQGKLRVTVVRATNLKNMEKIGKSDPYVRLYVRVLFKKKTKVIDNNLNPEWNEVFEFDVEDTETQSLVLQVKDEDIGTDKELGITTVSLHDLKPDTEIEVTKRLFKSLDTVRVKDKGDRGSITVRLLYHPYTKEEQDIAMAIEKGELEAKEELKNAGVVGGAMDAVGGGVKMVGTGFSTVGSGGAKLVGTGVGAVGSGVVRASRMMSSGVKRLSSNHRLVNSASPTPLTGSPMRETNGLFKSKEV
ncbi:hypothetical protein KC19_12G051100 [Ceratodon purpureus]|uniref:Uncharacterized protein n=1 Tax=Ceratodon purpureus TaxID=3225 RepID=A0A8T0G9J1_CERPU|nr:hypothetical protein KC19_12G051100 [Ceratodon purpureus]